jgi:hypothetical protein
VSINDSIRTHFATDEDMHWERKIVRNSKLHLPFLYAASNKKWNTNSEHTRT